MIINIFLIALGGSIGSLLRYFSSNYITKIIRFSNYAHIPFNTIFINVVGCFLAGIVYYFSIKHFDNFDSKYKNFLFVGIFGSYTTFSTFSIDFFRLFNANLYLTASFYAISSVILSLMAIFFGFYLMKILF